MKSIRRHRFIISFRDKWCESVDVSILEDAYQNLNLRHEKVIIKVRELQDKITLMKESENHRRESMLNSIAIMADFPEVENNKNFKSDLIKRILNIEDCSEVIIRLNEYNTIEIDQSKIV